MSLSERYRDLRRRLRLESVAVPLFVAERQVRHLRIVAGTLFCLSVVMGGVLTYRWQTGKARALRILVERQLVQTSLSVAAYDQGIRQVQSQALVVFNDKTIPDRDRLARFFSLDVIGLELIANREAMGRAMAQAEAAQKALPSRITSGTRWTDPLTGEAFRAKATREEIANQLVRRRMEGPDQEAFLALVVIASRPGAQALPTPAEILEGAK